MNTIHKYLLILTGVVLVGVLMVAVPAANAQTNTSEAIDQLQNQIQSLLDQVRQLQQQVVDLKGGIGVGLVEVEDEESDKSNEIEIPEITRVLSIGSRGDDVRKLQKYLARDKDIYPDGLLTGYFGPLTQRAVKAFQKKHKVISSGDPETTGYGVFGPQTRSKLEEIGHGVVAGLIKQGAGGSGVVPTGAINSSRLTACSSHGSLPSCW
jgi:hypothetical protein